MSISGYDIKRAVSPLRLVFWGGILCVVDLYFTSTINGVRFRIDFASDVVGAIMFTVGVWQLRRFQVHHRYRSTMTFVAVVAAASVVGAIDDFFVYDVPVVLSVLFAILGLAGVVALIAFCVAMRWLCVEADLGRSARSWDRTAILVVVIYLIPVVLLDFAGIVAAIIDKPFRYERDLGAFVFVFLAILFAPMIHLFVSTSRMKREAQSISGDHVPPAFVVEARAVR